MGRSRKVRAAVLGWSLFQDQETCLNCTPVRKGFAEAARIIHHVRWEHHTWVAVVVDKENQASPRAEHQLERDVFPYRQDLTSEQAASPYLFLGGTDEQRAVQDLVRLHYVAYSRAQVLLLLLIVDEHLTDEPPALGLGTDADWLRQLIEVWPPRERKTRTAKRGAGVPQEGVVQHGFQW